MPHKSNCRLRAVTRAWASSHDSSGPGSVDSSQSVSVMALGLGPGAGEVAGTDYPMGRARVHAGWPTAQTVPSRPAPAISSGAPLTNLATPDSLTHLPAVRCAAGSVSWP